MRRRRWEVSPCKGRWQVTCDRERISECDTQGDGIQLAVTLCKRRWKDLGQLSTLKIKRPDGRIRDERTYGADPVRSKG